MNDALGDFIGNLRKPAETVARGPQAKPGDKSADKPADKAAERQPPRAAERADTTLAEQAMGWKAQLGLERMCADAWRWQSGNPDGYRGSAA